MLLIYLFVKCCCVPTIGQSVGSHINPKHTELLSYCGPEEKREKTHKNRDSLGFVFTALRVNLCGAIKHDVFT